MWHIAKTLKFYKLFLLKVLTLHKKCIKIQLQKEIKKKKAASFPTPQMQKGMSPMVSTEEIVTVISRRLV